MYLFKLTRIKIKVVCIFSKFYAPTSRAGHLDWPLSIHLSVCPGEQGGIYWLERTIGNDKFN